MRNLLIGALTLFALSSLVWAPATNAIHHDMKMVRMVCDDPPRMFEQDTQPYEPGAGMYSIAQAGTTWIGWKAGGSGPHSIGAPGVWDFDDGGTLACPTEDNFQEYIKNGAYAQGWTSEDALAQKGVYWHAEDYTDPALICSANPISGTYSAWCGVLTPDPGACFNAAPGYGHNWNQWLCRSVTLDPSTPSFSYNFNSNTEAGFDYCYVVIDSEFPDSCGWVGDNADTLRCYDGTNTWGSGNIDLTAWDIGHECDEVAFDNDYSGDSVKVCFVVISDGSWDDEDGMYDTCDGAFNIDDIVIDAAPSSGETITTDFETGTLEGWEACGGWSPGDYAAIRHRSSFINNDECGFDNCGMSDCVLAFWNPDIPGQYGNGGHYDGAFHKRAWSPTIDLDSYAPRGYVISADRYADLPVPNWIFYRYYILYWAAENCPAGAMSVPATDYYVYYVPTPSCDYREWGFSAFVPTTADSIKVGLSVWNGCEAWDKYQCTNGNESPVFDNVRVGVFEVDAPQAGIRDIENYTDAFPEQDSALPAPPDCDPSQTAVINAAYNLSSSGQFLRLGDSLVVALEEPDAMVELCFKIRPGRCTDITDGWFAKYPDTWAQCEFSNNEFCTRMDTVMFAGDGDTTSAYERQVVFPGRYASMIHENDPNYTGEGEEIFPDSLFTPGTKIAYYIRSSYDDGSPGPYRYLPHGAATGVEEDITTWYEVEVLPNDCAEPPNCLLYVDYFNRGAQPPIEEALQRLGRGWDRFDLRGESSHQGNGIGNRVMGPGRYRYYAGLIGYPEGVIGPSLAHLSRYTAMLVNSGTFGTNVVFSDGGRSLPLWDPTDDIDLLDQWINEGRFEGLWMSGNNIAHDFCIASSGPKPAFLANELAASLVDCSLRNLIAWDIQNDNCIVLKTRDGKVSSADAQYQITNKYAVRDSFWLSGIGCPEAYEFDVIDENDGASDLEHISALYCGQYPSSIDHVYSAPNSPNDSVRTRLDGFSVHLLRDNDDCEGGDNIALWIRDVLGGNRNKGWFYNNDTMTQYCPPQGPEDALLGVPRGRRTYVNALYQNYPNPFRGGVGTTIHYSVARPGKVEIRVFDVAGRLVQKFVDQAEPGNNYVVWDGRTGDGRKMASGVYFYQIRAGEFTGHKKMLLVN